MKSPRRTFLKNTALGLVGAGIAAETSLFAQSKGIRPNSRPETVSILNPRDRVPVSLIIDDSTCLVNLAHFGIPQFAEVFPDRYQQPWKTLPREIPDTFVREFAEWCHDQGVKGKYSIVPFPACVGWVDRRLPGWSYQELQDSLQLVRGQIVPDWDIHPEMISHTFVIDTQTGRPYTERSASFMENWAWTDGKSVDQLADYMRYALEILKNVGLFCEGITTPGGFGNRVLAELAQATLQSCRDVFRVEIPHYFRHVFTGDESVVPRVEYAADLDGDDPKCVVSIIGCTDDWFGGWDGLEPGSADKFITKDLQAGRLLEVIEKGEPAIMVCHWPGIYFNGEKTGLKILQAIVQRLNDKYDHLIWMKLSEISRYWAARELTSINEDNGRLIFKAPFAAPFFTIRVRADNAQRPVLVHKGERIPLTQIGKARQLSSGDWLRSGNNATLCFDLPRGYSEILWDA